MSRNRMTCDAAFEVLTRGPFPTGGPEDRDVERHLRVCHECHHLAEALHPAVALLHESVTDIEAQHLPRYHGPLCRPTLWTWLASGGIESRWGFTRAGVTAVTALMAVVVALAAIVHWSAPPQFQARRTSAAHRAPATLSDRGGEMLAALALGDRCAPAALVTTLAGGVVSDFNAADGLACCTECHGAARSRNLTGPAMRDVMASCRACHENS